MQNQTTQPANAMVIAQMNADEGEREIDLVELGYELLDKIKYIIGTALLGGLLAALYVFMLATPLYEATAKLYVLNSSDSVVNLSDLQLGNYLASDYMEVFKTWEVKEMVRNNLGLSYTYGQLDDMVDINNPANTRILYITVTSADPQEAMNIANEYARVVSNYVSNIMATEKPNTLSQAILPTTPVSPQKTKTLIIGILLGILLSAGIIVVRFVLDDTIKSAEDVAKYTGLAVLAIVPFQEGAKKTQNKHRRSDAA